MPRGGRGHDRMRSDAPENQEFPNTSWGLVRAAGASAESRFAFAALCRRYWLPIYASLRRQGFPASDAEDLTQAFFLHLTERDTVARADPQRGRFRDFLVGVLRWFLAHEHERARALKRGGDAKFVAIDVAEAEARLPLAAGAPNDPFELQFDRQWAEALVRNALDELAGEYAASGQGALFVALRPCLDPGGAAPSYGLLAQRLERSEGAVKVAVHRLRQRFRELLRNEVAATVADARDVDEELAHLRDVLALDAAPAVPP